MNKVLLAASVAALLSASVARAEVSSGHLDYSVSRSYRVISGSRKPRVGVLFLHGAVDEAHAQESFDRFYLPILNRIAKELPAVVVFPEARAGGCAWDKTLRCWPFKSPWDDGPFLTDLVQKVGRDAGVQRWIGVGFSNGGYFLASTVLSGERLPLESVVLCASGRGWYGAPRVAWTPAVAMLAGKNDDQAKDEPKEVYGLLRGSYGDKKILTFEEFDGGHELPEGRLLKILRRLTKTSP